jgi:hypothetical protein
MYNFAKDARDRNEKEYLPAQPHEIADRFSIHSHNTKEIKSTKICLKYSTVVLDT